MDIWWVNTAVPEQYTRARVVSLYKKGKPEVLDKYRPISLLTAMYKVYAVVLKKRLVRAMDAHLQETIWLSTDSQHSSADLWHPQGIELSREVWLKGEGCIFRLRKGIRQASV